MKRVWFHFTIVVVLGALAGGHVFAQTPMGTAFTYQGQLKEEGLAVSETADFKFTLWDAAVNGNQVGPTLTFDGQAGNPGPVTVTFGLFTVKLDFGLLSFPGLARWLNVEVRCPHDPGNTGPYEPLTPRQELTPTPYAICALFAPLVPHNHFGETWAGNDNNWGLRIQNHDLNNLSYGLRAEDDSSLGTGIFGHATAVNGPAYGVEGWSDSDDGVGVYGYARNGGNGVDSTYGVYGRSDATTGTGVLGYASSFAGDTYGVEGWAESVAGVGVYGWAKSMGNGVDKPYGVYGQSDASLGIGVGGYATANNSVNFGVDGKSQSNSQRAAGVRAEGNGTMGAGSPNAAALKIVNGAVTVTGGVRPAGTLTVDANGWNARASSTNPPPDPNGHSHTIGYTKTATLTNPLIILDQSIILLTVEGYFPGVAGCIAHVESKANGTATIRLSTIGAQSPGAACKVHYLIINPVTD